MNTKQDIENTFKMIENFNLLDTSAKNYKSLPTKPDDFDTYSKVFPFTNERINCYYKHFQYDGNILTVAGSGDNLIHSILMDCKDINYFDINCLTYYYINLKLAAIKGLDNKEFIQYFTDKENECLPSLDYELYKKISIFLKTDVKYFWDTMYKKYLKEDNLKFQNAFFFSDGNYKYNDYLNDKEYFELRKNIEKERKIEFINKDILLLDDKTLNNKYSSIFLSNIADYIEDTTYFKEFLLNKIIPTLQDNGVMMYNYQWGKTIFYRGKGFCSLPCKNEKAFIYKKNK